MSDKTIREASKADWCVFRDGLASVNAGSLQRIADAAELMARRYEQLIKDRDLYERWYRTESAKAAKLRRSNAALRGVIAKLKAEAAKREGQDDE